MATTQEMQKARQLMKEQNIPLADAVKMARNPTPTPTTIQNPPVA